MNYTIASWEDNGYHDSYFYTAFFDSESFTIHKKMTGATAFAGHCGVDGEPMRDAPVAIKAAFRSYCCDRAAQYVLEGKEEDRLTPQAVEFGDKLVLLRDVRGKAPAGTTGEVFWQRAFGAFYRKGYNKPNRENTRVGLRLNDGTRVFVPLSACRRNVEAEHVDSIRARMESLWDSGEFNLAPLAGCTAWLSEQYVF